MKFSNIVTVALMAISAASFRLSPAARPLVPYDGIENPMKRNEEAELKRLKTEKREPVAESQKLKVDKREPVAEPQRLKVEKREAEPQKLEVD